MKHLSFLYPLPDHASSASRLSRHHAIVIVVVFIVVARRLRESHDHAPLFRALHVALVVTSDPVPHGHEVEARLVEHVVHPGGDFQQPLRETVVEVLLLGGVIKGRVPEVVRTVGYQVLLELRVVPPRELLTEDDRLGVDGSPALAELVVLVPRRPRCGGRRRRRAEAAATVRLNLVANSRGDLIVGLGGVQGRGDRRVVVGLVRIVDGGRRRMIGRVGRRPRQGFGGVVTPPSRGMGRGGGVLRPVMYGRWELGRMVLVGIVTSAAAPSSRGDIQGRGVLLRRLAATASAGVRRRSTGRRAVVPADGVVRLHGLIEVVPASRPRGGRRRRRRTVPRVVVSRRRWRCPPQAVYGGGGRDASSVEPPSLVLGQRDRGLAVLAWDDVGPGPR